MARSPQQNFDAMRQDAIRRSREMQRRAMPMPPPPPVPPAPIPEHHQPKQEHPVQNPHLSDELQNLLTGWNGEKLALLALLYLLYKEGAETELLLAIAYILL